MSVRKPSPGKEGGKEQAEVTTQGQVGGNIISEAKCTQVQSAVTGLQTDNGMPT